MFRKDIQRPIGQTAGVVESDNRTSQERASDLGITLEQFYLIFPENAGDDWRRYVGLKVGALESILAITGLESPEQKNAREERSRLRKLKADAINKVFGKIPE